MTEKTKKSATKSAKAQKTQKPITIVNIELTDEQKREAEITELLKKELPNGKPELKAHAEDLVTAYNECYQDAKFDTAQKLNSKLEETVNKYTSIAREEVFNQCKAAEDPMLEAVKVLVYKTIRVKVSKVGESKIPVSSIEEAEKYIDLLKLNKAVNGGIGHDKKWLYMIEKLNMHLTIQTAKELGVKNVGDINKSFAMQEASKQIALGKNPCSNTSMLKTLQSIVTAMLGDGHKAVSWDVKFIHKAYCKKGKKALTIVCANNKQLTQYIAEVCHRIVTGELYSVEYKKIKS